MRSLVIALVLATGSTVRADPALPMEVVAQAKPSDWAIYQGDRPERFLAIVDQAKRVSWFRSGKADYPGWETDHQAVWEYRLVTNASKDTVANLKTEAATCKLAATFACTKVTFTTPDPGNTKSTISVTLLLSDRIRATGLVELEIKNGASAVSRAKLVAYGNADKAEWGKAPTANQLGFLYGVINSNRIGILGSGSGTGYGPGTTPQIAKLSAITTTGDGDLDVAIIRRYIKRNLAKLTYCYEKELLAKPKLEGDVKITFEIGADGKVAKVAAKGFDATVDGCVRNAQPGELPKPKNGKPMTASYTVTYQPPPPPASKPLSPTKSRQGQAR